MKPVKGALTAILTIALLTLFLIACGQDSPIPPGDNTTGPTPPPTPHTTVVTTSQSTTLPSDADSTTPTSPQSAFQSTGEEQQSTATPPTQSGKTPSPTMPVASTPPSQVTKEPTPTLETGGVCERHPSVRQAILDQTPGLTCSQVDDSRLRQITQLEGLHLPVLLPEQTENMPNLEHIQITLANPVLATAHLFKLRTLDITIQPTGTPVDGPIAIPDSYKSEYPSILDRNVTPECPRHTPPVPGTTPEPSQGPDPCPFRFHHVSLTLNHLPVDPPTDVDKETWEQIRQSFPGSGLNLIPSFVTRELHITDNITGCPSLKAADASKHTRAGAGLAYVSEYARFDCHPPLIGTTSEIEGPVMDLNHYTESGHAYGAWLHGPGPVDYHPQTLEINNHYTEDYISFHAGFLKQDRDYIQNIVLTGHLSVNRIAFLSAHQLRSVRIEQTQNPTYPVTELHFPQFGVLPEAHGFEPRPGHPDD